MTVFIFLIVVVVLLVAFPLLFLLLRRLLPPDRVDQAEPWRPTVQRRDAFIALAAVVAIVLINIALYFTLNAPLWLIQAINLCGLGISALSHTWWQQRRPQGKSRYIYRSLRSSVWMGVLWLAFGMTWLTYSFDSLIPALAGLVAIGVAAGGVLHSLANETQSRDEEIARR